MLRVLYCGGEMVARLKFSWESHGCEVLRWWRSFERRNLALVRYGFGVKVAWFGGDVGKSEDAVPHTPSFDAKRKTQIKMLVIKTNDRSAATAVLR